MGMVHSHNGVVSRVWERGGGWAEGRAAMRSASSPQASATRAVRSRSTISAAGMGRRVTPKRADCAAISAVTSGSTAGVRSHGREEGGVLDG